MVRPRPGFESLRNPDALPCENDQAKPDRFLTTGTFNQFVKDPKAIRLSGALLDRGPDFRLGVPELVRFCRFCIDPQPAAFLRELFEVIELQPLCQGESLLTDSIPQPGIAQRKFSNIHQQKYARAARARGRFSSGSCNGLFSLGIPYRGQRVNRTTSPGPANRPPISLIGQDSQVHREAPLLNLQLPKSSTRYPPLQADNSSACNFPRIPADPHGCKRRTPVESSCFCGKTRA